MFAKPNEIKEKTAFGSKLEIIITNLGSNAVVVKVSPSGEDKEILLLDSRQYEIAGADSKVVPFKIQAPKSEGVYQASVLVETGTQRLTVPIKLTVQKRTSLALGGISFLFYEWTIPLPSGLEVKIPTWVIIFSIVLVILVLWVIKK